MYNPINIKSALTFKNNMKFTVNGEDISKMFELYLLNNTTTTTNSGIYNQYPVFNYKTTGNNGTIIQVNSTGYIVTKYSIK